MCLSVFVFSGIVGIQKPGLSREKSCFMRVQQIVEKPIMQSKDI